MNILKAIEKAAPAIGLVCAAIGMIAGKLEQKATNEALVDKATEKVLQKLSEQN